MYIFKNAITSITRNKSRNLLIGIIVIVIACATTVTLAIRSSANSLIETYENQYEVTASIGINRENMRGQMRPQEDATEEDREEQRNNMTDIFSSISNITVDEIEDYANSSYVKDYYYQISIGLNSNELEKVSMSTNNEQQNNMSNQMPPNRENFQNIESSDFTLIGYSKTSAMQDFISGKNTIISGEISEDMDSNNCVINTELATANEIEVGDTITLVDPNNDSNTLELTVTGIYEETSDTEDQMAMFTSSANMIITSTTVVNNFASSNEDIQKSVTPTFILTDKNVIDKFSEELTEKGLSEYLSVSTNLDEVENATSTISNVSTFATTFLVITLIIGGIVLLVINMINIRERRYEIGVLRTIGMKKSMLTLQFISELLIVSLIALVIGAFIGSLMSVSVSNSLLQNEIESAQTEKDNINNNFGRGPNQNMDKINGVREIQAFDSIDAAVDLNVLLQLLVIGIVLTLISSSAAMISIQKFSPLTILKERS